MIKKVLFFILVLFLIGLADAGVGYEIYISPDGDDSNPGTFSQPFQSIERAQQMVRTINDDMTEDIIVYLRSGTYYLNSTLEFSIQDSGANDHYIIYQSYPGETAIISGGRQISNWTQHSGNIWVANAESIDSRQLYVDGVRATRAEEENLATFTKTTRGYNINNSNLQSYNNIEDMEIVAFADPIMFQIFRCGVKEIIGNEMIIDEDCWHLSHNYGISQLRNIEATISTPSHVENAYEFLDNPGEWYIDKQTNQLYYIPIPGVSPIQSEIILPEVEKLVMGVGVSNLKFKNLKFYHATWLAPNMEDGFATVQADMYHIKENNSFIYQAVMGNIEFRNSNNIEFEYNEFAHLGGTGLAFLDPSGSIEIRRNQFYDISASGIQIDTTNSQGLIDIAVNNNYIHNIAKEFMSSIGIFGKYIKDTTISNNEINDLPYSGISIGWGWAPNVGLSSNVKVQNNNIQNTVNFLQDGGGIYNLADSVGTDISGNVITEGSIIDSYGSAIYLDEGTIGVFVHDNVIFNSGRTFVHKGCENQVYSNHWRDRGLYLGDPDIRIWHAFEYSDSETACFDTYYGSFEASSFTNNQIISSLNQAPSDILDGAGIQENTLTSVPADYDGDGIEEKATYDVGEWTIIKSDGEIMQFVYGGEGDIPVPADYDGDGQTDIAIYRLSSLDNLGRYYINFSSGQEPSWIESHSMRDNSSGVVGYNLGWEGTQPITGDFDGDGMSDLALYKPDWGEGYDWVIRYSSGLAEKWLNYGAAGYEPAVADYDGDGQTDIAIYEIATGFYSINFSSGQEPSWLANINQFENPNGDNIQRRDDSSSFPRYQLGWEGTQPITGDFDGDGMSDLALYRPDWSGSNGYYDWVIVYSGERREAWIDFGSSGDLSAIADYDGDGQTDIAIFNPNSNNWNINYSNNFPVEVCDNDGVCDAGETVENCPNDCYEEMDDFCIQHQERYTEEEIDLELGRWITGELSLAEIMLRIRVFRACAI